MNVSRKLLPAGVLWAIALAPALAQDAGQASGKRRGVGDEVRIGSSLALPAGERAADVVVIGASARISGTATGDVVVLGGTLQLDGSAVVHGDAVVVGGSVKVEDGVTIGGDLVVIGAFEAPSGFKPGGELVVMSADGAGSLAAPLEWSVRGPLRGRLLVPDLLWTWIALAIAALLAFAVAAIFDKSVRECAMVVAERPLTAFLVGALVTVLAVPVTLLLAISLIGIPLLPLLWVTFSIAWLIGTVGILRWTGAAVLAERTPNDRVLALRSVAIGVAILAALSLVPVVALLAAIMLSPLATGCSAMVLHRRLRRERGWPQDGGDGSGVGSPPASDPDEPHDAAAADLSAVQSPDQPSQLVDGATGVAGPAVVRFRQRLAAAALDFIPIACLGAVADAGVRLTLLAFLLYCVAMWALRSATVGAMVCRIRVVRSDGSPLTPADAAVRGLAGIFSIIFLGIGWLWAAWDKRGQAWHDRAAGTFVVPDHPQPNAP